jgi:hypothetical protein
MPSRGGSSETPLPDIPEETTPLRLLAKTGQHRQPLKAASKGPRSGASRHSGARNSRSAAAVKEADAAKAAHDGDLESPDPSSATSWLSQKLRWPVVPIYSDVGTGLLGMLHCSWFTCLHWRTDCPAHVLHVQPYTLTHNSSVTTLRFC